MSVTTARQTTSITLKVEGPASVRVVAELLTGLQEALADGLDITVDLSEATSVDAAFYQLMVSARSSLPASGGSLVVIDPAGLLEGAFQGN